MMKWILLMVLCLGLVGCKDDYLEKQAELARRQIEKDNRSLLKKIKKSKDVRPATLKLKPWDPAKVKIVKFPSRPFKRHTYKYRSARSIRKWIKRQLSRDKKEIEQGTGTLCHELAGYCRQGTCHQGKLLLCKFDSRWKGRALWTVTLRGMLSCILAKKWNRKMIRGFLATNKDVIDGMRRLGYSTFVFSTLAEAKRTYIYKREPSKPWFGLAVDLP